MSLYDSPGEISQARLRLVARDGVRSRQVDHLIDERSIKMTHHDQDNFFTSRSNGHDLQHLKTVKTHD